jgi:hypothetical protein
MKRSVHVVFGAFALRFVADGTDRMRQRQPEFSLLRCRSMGTDWRPYRRIRRFYWLDE